MRRRWPCRGRGGPRALRGRLYGIHHRPVPQVHQGRWNGTPEARMRCTRVGWARGSPRRPSVSGRGGFSRQRWFDYGRLARLCDSYLRSGSVDLGKWRRSRLAEPVVPGLAVVMERWEAYLAGSGLASATVGHYRRMAGLFLTWLESHGGRVVGRFGWLACAGVPGRAAFTLVGVVDAARRVGPAPVVQMARAG